MPSRMERYADVNMTRTAKNKELYEQIYGDKEFGDKDYTNKEYTNVQGIVKAPVTNSVDIEKVKEILNRRKEAQKYLQGKVRKTPQIDLNIEDDEEEEAKNYDIKDVLDKAKEERPVDTSEYHSLKNTEFNILKNLKINKEKNEEESGELKELINTITNTSLLNKIGDKELSLDLLDDLKSKNSDTTIISGSDVIRNVLKEEDKKEEPEEEMDKSFYTKSLNLTEDLEGLQSENKANKMLVRIFLIVSIVAVVVVGIVIIYTLLKK